MINVLIHVIIIAVAVNIFVNILLILSIKNCTKLFLVGISAALFMGSDFVIYIPKNMV